MTNAATFSGGTSCSRIVSISSRQCAAHTSASCAGLIGQPSGYGNGATWTSGSRAPYPRRYAAFDVVSVAAPVVRPWNPPRKTTIA